MTDFDKHNLINMCTTMSEMTIGGDALIGEAQDIWGCGQLELMMELAEYAVFSEEELSRRNPEDYPGVYDYEVSDPFGAWFMQYVINHNGDVPPFEVGKAKLLELMDTFFGEELK